MVILLRQKESWYLSNHVEEVVSYVQRKDPALNTSVIILSTCNLQMKAVQSVNGLTGTSQNSKVLTSLTSSSLTVMTIPDTFHVPFHL